MHGFLPPSISPSLPPSPTTPPPPLSTPPIPPPPPPSHPPPSLRVSISRSILSRILLSFHFSPSLLRHCLDQFLLPSPSVPPTSLATSIPPFVRSSFIPSPLHPSCER